MIPKAIISDGEALQILAMDLRKQALEKHAEELKTSATEARAKLLQQIERDVEKEIRRRTRKNRWDVLLH